MANDYVDFVENVRELASADKHLHATLAHFQRECNNLSHAIRSRDALATELAGLTYLHFPMARDLATYWGERADKPLGVVVQSFIQGLTDALEQKVVEEEEET